jgi:hypothetical protein
MSQIDPTRTSAVTEFTEKQERPGKSGSGQRLVRRRHHLEGEGLDYGAEIMQAIRK